MAFREVIPFPQTLDFLLKLPGSKSITERAYFCAALARGKSRIFSPSICEDAHSMLAALKKMGIRVQQNAKAVLMVGKGGILKKGSLTLDALNSGVTARFLTALASLRPDSTIIRLGSQMAVRPMKPLHEALLQLKQKKNLIRVKGSQSSQYISALLMVAPLADYPLRIRVLGNLTSPPYVEMTLAVMKAFGVRVKKRGRDFWVKPQSYKPCDYWVEGDATAGTYFSSINHLHEGTLRFSNLGLPSIQGDVNYPRILQQFGRGNIDMNSMPDAAVTAAVTAGLTSDKTKITGLQNLVFKESDRLKALQKGLRRLGIGVTATKSSITIQGNPQVDLGNRSIKIHTYQDHRLAMSFAVLGTKLPGLQIENPDCVKKSYPGFWEDLERAYLSPLRLGQKNLVLIGMRGAGKSYLGQKIARHLKRKFVDFDREIERDQGMSVSQMVRRYGWPYFRKVEQKICSKYRSANNLVIATGGGVVLDPGNMKALKAQGIIVFIFADPSVLVKRLRHQKNRPLLSEKNPWPLRRPLYLYYADYVWDNTSWKIIEKSLNQIFK